MKVLVIGSGGREHALAWKLAQSPLVDHVYVAPGNAGTHRELNVSNIEIDPLNFSLLIDFVKQNKIDFTVVGPEAPLVAGIVDAFNQQQLLCLGPTQFAAQLEGSKAFAKQFMVDNHIPTAQAKIFTQSIPAIEYLKTLSFPVVIKADGLAGGKGVVIVHDQPEAILTIENMLLNKRFGEASQQIVIEEFIQGEEVSFIVLCDGEHALPLATSQDHKTRDEGDKGPNTGGMGAYSPAPIVDTLLHEKIMQEVIQPTLQGMAKMGAPFKGFLYAGLMITPSKEIKVLEYNCRFGDPETQPILMRLRSDFASLCLGALHGQLDMMKAEWDSRSALGVVLAANGYPDKVATLQPIPPIHDVALSEQNKIFHAGTTLIEGKMLTNGGRVLCVVALGDTLKEAHEKAYQLIDKVQWDGVFCRRDIGHRALTKEDHSCHALH